MSIAAIALAGLYRTVGQSSKNVVDIETRIEAALVARSVLASTTYAEDAERLQAGESGVWHWRIQVQPEQIPVLDEGGKPGSDKPLRAARTTVEVAISKNGPSLMTWTTWKPYRAAP